jgi:hypothetical protein
MRLGSWRDAEVVRDVKIGALAALVVLFGLGLPEGFRGLVFVPVAAGILGVVVMRLWGGTQRSTSALVSPHPGPNASRIPVAGFPGLVLVVGFIWMFWFGVPSFRPIVIAAAVLGVLCGAAAITLGKRHRVPSATLLGVGHGPDVEGQGGNRRLPAAEQRDEADER